MMKSKVPSYIVHYARGKPFQSITNVPPRQLAGVIENLNETNAWGLDRFSHPEYLAQRIKTEKMMRHEFIGKGGRPTLEHPVYFFLGRHPGFEVNPNNKIYTIDLGFLFRESVTFSYGDTMLSYVDENRKQSGAQYQNQLCGKLFTLDQLEDLYSNPLFPLDSPLAVEAHLWVQPQIQIVTTLGR
jgi:hypothetical protein